MRSKKKVTDQEIMGYDNVPVDVAAAYIDIGAQALRLSQLPVWVHFVKGVGNGFLRRTFPLQHQPWAAGRLQAGHIAVHAHE